MQAITSKLQGRGYLTVPQIVRDKLGLKQGEEVAFIIKEDGEVALRPVKEMAQKAAELDEFFLETGIPFEEWKEAGKNIRSEVLKEMYPKFAKENFQKEIAMLKFFVDANVIFAMVYSNKGASSELLTLAQKQKVTLITSQYALQEARRRITEKYPSRRLAFGNLEGHAILQIVEIDEDELDAASFFVADPDDAPIIAAAKRAKPDALVSFDRKHIHTRAVEKFINAPVITAGDALALVRRAS